MLKLIHPLIAKCKNTENVLFEISGCKKLPKLQPQLCKSKWSIIKIKLSINSIIKYASCNETEYHSCSTYYTRCVEANWF